MNELKENDTVVIKVGLFKGMAGTIVGFHYGYNVVSLCGLSTLFAQIKYPHMETIITHRCYLSQDLKKI